MRLLLIVFATMVLHCQGVFAGDWPQVLGPNRDGHAVNETLPAWTQPPKVRWKVACGAGYAGVAVVNEQVFLWHREDDEERLDCLSAVDGQRRWRAAFPATYRGGVDPDTGPRCVPVVTSDSVYVYGAAGDLHAVDLASGTKRWTRELRADYDANDGYFGAGSTPIVVGNLVIATVGGRDGAGLVAVDARDGTTQWKAIDDGAAYASPITIQIAQKTRVIAVLGLTTVMIDPATGDVLQSFDFGKRGPTVNAATPIARDSQLFMTASYGIGCRMLDMSTNPPTDRWKANDTISSQYASPVRIGDSLFAIDGREDMGDASLLCASWEDGKINWRNNGFGTAHLIAVENQVLAQTTDGRIELIEGKSDAYRSLATFALPEGSYRALPALARGILYCRRTTSSQTSELLACDMLSGTGE